MITSILATALFALLLYEWPRYVKQQMSADEGQEVNFRLERFCHGESASQDKRE